MTREEIIKYAKENYVFRHTDWQISTDGLVRFAERERIEQEEKSKALAEASALLAGAVWRMNEYGYIQTFEKAEEDHCAHWRDIAIDAVVDIRKLLSPNARVKAAAEGSPATERSEP
jgi:hypothetical protein